MAEGVPTTLIRSCGILRGAGGRGLTQAQDNKRRLILERVEAIAETITHARPGEHVVIGLDERRIIHSVINGMPVSRELPAVAPFKAR